MKQNYVGCSVLKEVKIKIKKVKKQNIVFSLKNQSKKKSSLLAL
jgi:hypothetical protein